MKQLLTLLALALLSTDSSPDFSLLAGSWKQHNFANTGKTAVFTFRADSTATLEMRQGDSDAMIGGMNGPYQIHRNKDLLLITMLGKEKQFHILTLTADTLKFQNEKENKKPEIFIREK